MSADKPNKPNSSKEAPRRLTEEELQAGVKGSIKATLPMGSIPRVELPENFDPKAGAARFGAAPSPVDAEQDAATSATRKMPAVTFPPERWGKERDLISSASAPTSQRMKAVSGTVTLNSERLPENLARELITRRFEQYDYDLEGDYQFTYKDVVVTLDGFDQRRRVGYQYISHADQDVVTDHDVATTETFQQLDADGIARVLVIHDGEVITGDALIELVDTFLSVPSPG